MKKKCPKCGRRYSEIEMYCTKCGIKLVKEFSAFSMASVKTDATKMEKAKKIENLLTISQYVADYLQKNFHPHTTVVIEVDSIRVEETLAGKIIEYERD